MTFSTALELGVPVQVVIPDGTVVIVQVPAEVGPAAFVGPETVAVNANELPNTGVEAFAVTTGITVTKSTFVACARVVEVEAGE